MKTTVAALVIAIAAFAEGASADAGIDHDFAVLPYGPADFLSEQDRGRIWAAIDAERAKLALPKAGPRPTFRWPLRASGGYELGFARVSNYVDHESLFPNQLRDFNCGTRTYDRPDGYNHTGTDISLSHDPWNLMAAGQVEIVAAAPGIIIMKTDGNFDQSCAQAIGSQWNAVYVQHDDGSVAWYGHMKNGSTTTKSIGARVVAGEYLGKVGSSGNSSGPHLHLEVFDSARRLVDPFAGACNRLNTGLVVESQPAYHSTQIMGLATATAPPVGSSCGTDGRLANPGSYNRKSAFARGETVWFITSVRDMTVGERVRYVVRAPDGSEFAQTQNSVATAASNGSNWWAPLALPSNAPVGTWMVEARVADSVFQTPFTVSADGGPIANYTDLWWNPAEPGWGVNLSHQGEKLFATWFTYDTDGAGLWLVMSDGVAQGSAIGGALYRTTGTPLEQIAGRPAITGAPTAVGSASFRFTDAEHATMSYIVNGIAQSKSLVRQRFSAAATCMLTRGTRTFATNYQDLWWNPAESGWGINLVHQGDVIFATWFTYGSGGRGVWYVASDVRRQATGEFRGTLYRTSGRPFDQIAGPGPMLAISVGEITLTFADGEHGRLDYIVGGIAQSKAITRQVFAESAPLCK